MASEHFTFPLEDGRETVAVEMDEHISLNRNPTCQIHAYWIFRVKG